MVSGWFSPGVFVKFDKYTTLVRWLAARICELSRLGWLPLIGAPKMSAGGAPILCPLCPFFCPWRDFVGCLVDLCGWCVFCGLGLICGGLAAVFVWWFARGARHAAIPLGGA